MFVYNLSDVMFVIVMAAFALIVIIAITIHVLESISDKFHDRKRRRALVKRQKTWFMEHKNELSNDDRIAAKEYFKVAMKNPMKVEETVEKYFCSRCTDLHPGMLEICSHAPMYHKILMNERCKCPVLSPSNKNAKEDWLVKKEDRSDD